jgi:cytochrome c oxidase cbb3-type subunit III
MSLRMAVTIVGAMALATLGLGGCDAMPGRPHPGERPVVPSEVMAFSAVYGQHCAGCHGADGRLGGARPLNDPVYLALVPQDRLRTIIAQGIPGTAMPAFSTSSGGALAETQIGMLGRAMLTHWGRPSQTLAVPLPPYTAEEAIIGGSGPGDPEQGRKVYAEACARCHGPHGNGGPKGGSIVDAAYLALASEQALRTAVIAGRTDLGMPDWREAIPGQPLTPRQISDVVAWLVSQRQPVMGRSTAGIYAEEAKQ